MFFNYGYKVSKILNEAEKERLDLHHPYVGSEHLLLSILNNDPECINIFKEFNITYNSFKETLIDIVGKASKKQELNLYTPLLKRIIADATDISLEDKREVTCKDLIISLLEESEGIAYRILIRLDVDTDKLYKRLKNNNLEDSLTLEIGVNLNKTIDMEEKIVGREDKINEIIEILLRKKKNNPLLIGKAGVGKTAIVEELARKINNNEVPSCLKDKQIISLEMSSLVAGTKYRGEFEERLNKIINEIKDNKNIILFVDEVHTIANAGGSEGAINAADILKPYMARGDIKIIGATTLEEYDKYIIKDKALERRFEKILIEEPSKEEMLNLMINVKKEYERYHHIKISNEVIKYLVLKADELIVNKNNPDKCIELLDSICSHVRLNNKNNDLNEQKLIDLKNKYLIKKDYKKATYYLKEQLSLDNKNNYIRISKKDVLDVIYNKIKIPSKDNYSKIKSLLKISSLEKNKLLDLLKDKYNNINIIKNLLIIGDNKKTLDVLINYYNPLSKPLIIDLKEYDNINKLIGVSAGYIGYNDDYALKKINNYPYSLVIFKNIDKAKKDIKTIINKIIKEGKITNGKGDILDFTKSLVIGTIDKELNKGVGFNRDNSTDNLYNFNSIINLNNSLTK